MSRQLYRIVLVIGDNHEEIIKKYSADTKVERYLFMKREDANKHRLSRLKRIKTILDNKELPLTENQKELYKMMYLDIKDMSDADYYQEVTDGCHYDEITGDAYSDTNINDYYQYAHCPQKRFLKTKEESTFSNPFILKDGSRSYSAKVKEIDWSKMHMANTAPYIAAWEMVVEGRKPSNEQEQKIFDVMHTKVDYFKDNFKNKDEYVHHSCSFWCYGVATSDEYKELDYTISDTEWIRTFYDKFIVPLDGEQRLTIYEVRSL